MKVELYDKRVDDSLLKYAVIISMFQDHWVFCRHHQRTTYEIPGGHREAGEKIEEAAKRELYEETGACKYDLNFMCDYSVQDNEKIDYGRIYLAKISEFDSIPKNSEIQEIIITDSLPEDWTYPDIQPLFIKYYQNKYKK